MGRRGRGEGSIYQRKDGLWVGQYEVHLETGMKKKYLYSRSKKEVAKKLAEAIANRDKGIIYDPQSFTLEGYLSRWLDSVNGTIRPRAYERYEQSCRLHINPYLGKTKLDRLNPLQIQALYKRKLDSGLAPRTVQIIHATLSKALRQAVVWSLIHRSPAESVQPPKASIREMTPLSQGQTKIFLEAARGNKLEALYVLAITTGMRQGELLGLQWKDVELDSRTLRVRRTIYYGEIHPPKTKKSRRNITLAGGAASALENHARVGEWVFSTKTGNPITSQNLTKQSFKPLLQKAGLPNIRFHDLRHTCATLLLSKNVHPKIVQELLGHANISITLDTYSHYLPNMQDRAVEAMDSFFKEEE